VCEIESERESERESEKERERETKRERERDDVDDKVVFHNVDLLRLREIESKEVSERERVCV